MLSLFRRLFVRKTVGYVSDIDVMLFEWFAESPKTKAEQAEMAKYQGIAKLRDEAQGQQDGSA